MNNITKKLIKESLLDKTIYIQELKNSMIGVKIVYTKIEQRYMEIHKLEKEIRELEEDLEER